MNPAGVLIEARAGDMLREAEITASVAQRDDHWYLDLRSDRLAQSVQIDFEALSGGA
ncbi:hypothetical protein [Rhizobium sophoriradicis]|uniref:hypothetical protein n=1 Tax=Rhizobium sophoriradicis TaxID=1535245 RepID=UPI0015CED445|nr:hypothetical protein [Rhizobium sophoriradicis]